MKCERAMAGLIVILVYLDSYNRIGTNSDKKKVGALLQLKQEILQRYP